MRPRFLVLVGIVIVLSIASLGGFAATYLSVRNTQDIVGAIQYSARRGDCIREVQADAEQQFRKDIADLLDAGRDPSRFRPLIARMHAAAKVNYADTVKRVCPPAVKESK